MADRVLGELFGVRYVQVPEDPRLTQWYGGTPSTLERNDSQQIKIKKYKLSTKVTQTKLSFSLATIGPLVSM